MKKIDFFESTVNQRRKQIRGIDDSYSHGWDILSELIQNSVDAIRKDDDVEGEIRIDIDKKKKSIVVTDNGCGINSSELPTLVQAFSTNKDTDSASIGEKGVGLTFVIFSSNKFSIHSGNDNGSAIATVSSAWTWKNSNDDTTLDIEYDDNASKIKGTRVELADIKNDFLFELTQEQLIFILRTKTAIGSTRLFWERDKNINVNLTVTDFDGKMTEVDVEYSYLLPFGLEDDNVIKFEEVEKIVNSDKTDAEKRRRLLNKILFQSGSEERAGRVIKYIWFYLPTRQYWEDYSLIHNLCKEGDWDAEHDDDDFFDLTFQSGIHTSVKGMPTGITIEHPKTYSAGWWSNVFMIFEDPRFSFDIGRKSVDRRNVQTISKLAKDIFNQKINKVVSRYAQTGGASLRAGQKERDEIRDELRNLPDIAAKKEVSFLKTPKYQEASVAAVFYECIGRGYIASLRPLNSGYKKIYDLYANSISGDFLSVEFKTKLKNLILDFSDEIKMFNEVNVLVCWGLDEDDEKIANQHGLQIEDVPSRGAESEYLPETTNLLTMPNNSPIEIIDLKKLLNE